MSQRYDSRAYVSRVLVPGHSIPSPEIAAGHDTGQSWFAGQKSRSVPQQNSTAHAPSRQTDIQSHVYTSKLHSQQLSRHGSTSTHIYRARLKPYLICRFCGTLSRRELELVPQSFSRKSLRYKLSEWFQGTILTCFLYRFPDYFFQEKSGKSASEIGDLVLSRIPEACPAR